jgi:hypothetical protein
MDPHFSDSTSLNGKTGSMAALRLELQQEAEEEIQFARKAPSRSPAWHLMAAILALLGMLLVFHYVVRESLRESELRHKAMALNAEAIWRCNNLQGREASGTCLLQVNAEARKVALLHAWTKP